jgi:hypothetical protein
MGYVIGDTGSPINTWAGVRGALTQTALNPSTFYAGNQIYTENFGYFKTTEGNGLLKRGLDPSFFSAALTIRINPSTSDLEVIYFDESYHDELIGQDVENDSVEVYTINADAFYPSSQVLTPSPTTTELVAIGLFEPIT